MFPGTISSTVFPNSSLLWLTTTLQYGWLSSLPSCGEASTPSSSNPPRYTLATPAGANHSSTAPCSPRSSQHLFHQFPRTMRPISLLVCDARSFLRPLIFLYLAHYSVSSFIYSCSSVPWDCPSLRYVQHGFRSPFSATGRACCLNMGFDFEC
jgi:hypothetical protein